jgi:hypothetical protein
MSHCPALCQPGTSEAEAFAHEVRQDGTSLGDPAAGYNRPYGRSYLEAKGLAKVVGLVLHFPIPSRPADRDPCRAPQHYLQRMRWCGPESLIAAGVRGVPQDLAPSVPGGGRAPAVVRYGRGAGEAPVLHRRRRVGGQSDSSG